MKHIISEIKLTYSSNKLSNLKIRSSESAYKILRDTWNMNTIELFEEFKVILMNRDNQVLGIYQVSKGSVAGTIADPKAIFGVALKCNASAIILAHNHPSGNLKPSEADIRLTKKFKNAGKLLDIEVYDHIIISSHNYFSFVDEAML